MTDLPTHVLILDLEGTALDPNAPEAAVLEIGAILCKWDPELPEVARASIVVRPPGLQADHDLMWSRMDPFVRDMHSRNGLWNEATTGENAWNLADADTAIARWLREHVDEQVPLAGSGVSHYDAPWCRAFLPSLAARFTYWTQDVGNVRRLLQLADRHDLVDLVTDVESKPHRSLQDCELHLAEVRRYIQLLQSIPRVTSGDPEQQLTVMRAFLEDEIVDGAQLDREIAEQQRWGGAGTLVSPVKCPDCGQDSLYRDDLQHRLQCDSCHWYEDKPS